jgi:hypothetical protein
MIRNSLCLVLTLALVWLPAGCCHHGERQPDRTDALPADVDTALKPHLMALRDNSAEYTLHRSAFTEAELIQLDRFVAGFTNEPFSKATVSKCGACTAGGGSKGMWLYFPQVHRRFCLPCGH